MVFAGVQFTLGAKAFEESGIPEVVKNHLAFAVNSPASFSSLSSIISETVWTASSH
jgi:hypothetical protein